MLLSFQNIHSQKDFAQNQLQRSTNASFHRQLSFPSLLLNKVHTFLHNGSKMTIPTVSYKKFSEPETRPPTDSSRRWVVIYLLLAASLLTTLVCWNQLSRGYIMEVFVDSNDTPPNHTEYAKMARYLVHKAEWVSMGSLSTVAAVKGFPMVNIISVADSARGAKSTGVLYFYLTMLDYTAQDLAKDNRLTVMLSLDQDLYCTKKGVDPMEPTCARIMISGTLVKINATESPEEYDFGSSAMFSRHPAAKKWIETDGHNFFLCKLNIVQIAVLDFYGGPHYVTVDEYMAADPDDKETAVSNTNARRVPTRFTVTPEVDTTAN
uniref:CREG-like beta-barrel domain-containing protein n=1 Tax=Anopheles atroparvus TaxID=41427 RepID=A0AAG5CSG4_ANOAO